MRTMRRKFGSGAVAACAWLCCLAPGVNAAEDCAPSNGITPLCGFQRPEDLEALPGGALILVSEYGALSGARPGRLKVLRVADGASTVVYPATVAPSASARATDEPWGDPTCPGPPGPEFSPHGIHHSEIGGASRVLVVNHGGREAVELFELGLDDDGASASLTWRGCVVAPDQTWMNDVAGLPDGGLAVTHMITRGTAEEALFEAERTREDTGDVLQWTPRGGWRRLPGTAGGLPNGIEVSADGSTLFVDYYFGDAVAAIDRASGRRLWQTEVAAPDNSSWAADGRLLVASHLEPLSAIFACNKDTTAPYCPLRFAIVALDAVSGTATRLFEAGGAPMGAATVALDVRGQLYLGSFVGGRMARVD